MTHYRGALLLVLIGSALCAQLPKANETKDSENLLEQYEEYADSSADDPEEILFSENKPCPRDCICSMASGFRTAKCNRLELNTQKFGDDITDLIIENVGAANPVALEDMIFRKLGLHQLSTIKIVNSTLAYIKPSAFHGLHELYSVNLSGNKIRHIDSETFASNKKLYLLSLANNQLQFENYDKMNSSKYFINSSSIQELDISSCNIKSIHPLTFSKMPNLMYINLSSNKLQKIDSKIFNDLPDLEEIDLSDNFIETLSDDLFSKNEEMATLHLNRNPMASVNGLQVSELLTLDIGNAEIKTIGPSMFDGMRYLSNLNLSGNGIRKIHNQAFTKLVELNYLDLSNNDLDFMSSVLIKENIDLDVFKIANNPNLRNLPADGFISAADQFNMYIFDASNCGLQDISENALMTFPALSQLNLSKNKLKTLSAGVFKYNTRLIEIDLSYNRLTKLDSKLFSQTKDLGKLNLRGNPLQAVSPDTFLSTPVLNWLDLSSCELNTIWQEKESRPAALLNNLHFLNISNNNIKTVQVKELEMIEKLYTLDVTNNPLACTDDFRELMKWLGDHRVSPALKDIMIANLEMSGKDENADLKWNFLVRKVCAQEPSVYIYKTSTAVPPAFEEIWQKVSKEPTMKIDKELYEDVEPEDGDDYDDDDDDENDDETGDQDIAIVSNDISLLTANANAVQKMEEEIIESEVLSSLPENAERRNYYAYVWPILIIISGVLILMAVIGKFVFVVCQKNNRRSRYNSAIIAAMSQYRPNNIEYIGKTKKDCGLVYQQLSEDLSGPKTPIVSRFAPLETDAKGNLSYQSSPFHHNNIVPEAV